MSGSGMGFKLILWLLCFSGAIQAQSPKPVLIGYLHNWNSTAAPFISLDQVNPDYDIINIAFATPVASPGGKMQFLPVQQSVPGFVNQIKSQQEKGKKILISVGGGADPVYIRTQKDKNDFVSSMNNILETYGFDGIDIDFEGSSLAISGGTINAPVDSSIIYTIEGIRDIMKNYSLQFNKKMMLTLAPETVHVQGGQSKYTGFWGAYLPVINALRDSIDFLHVQLYNSGTMYGIDRGIYEQGTADFIVALTEASIQGFPTDGGWFEGLPAHKIVIGLPACKNAAGGGYTHPVTVFGAVSYLRGNGVQPGKYRLKQAGGYPNLGGMMTWSINWDATTGCGDAYTYVKNFDFIFNSGYILANEEPSRPLTAYPNPVSETLFIRNSTLTFKNELKIFNASGQSMPVKTPDDGKSYDFSTYPAGLYFVSSGNNVFKIIKM